jgi:hypothetical protein
LSSASGRKDENGWHHYFVCDVCQLQVKIDDLRSFIRMACIEHNCTECDWYSCDNKPTHYCPKCGARCTNDFDEIPDHEENRDIEDE